MATLCSLSSKVLELSPVGYWVDRSEYSADLDWLNMRLRVDSGERNWECVHPALTTFEVQRLADWLDAVRMHGIDAGSHFYATEPNFQLTLENDSQPWSLRATFALAFAPDGGNAREDSETGHSVVLSLDADAISVFTSELRREMDALPTKGISLQQSH